MSGLVAARLETYQFSYTLEPYACPARGDTTLNEWTGEQPVCAWSLIDRTTRYCPAFLWASHDALGTRRIGDLDALVIGDRIVPGPVRHPYTMCLLAKQKNLHIGAKR